MIDSRFTEFTVLANAERRDGGNIRKVLARVTFRLNVPSQEWFVHSIQEVEPAGCSCGCQSLTSDFVECIKCGHRESGILA